jgi:hypothetical protein
VLLFGGGFAVARAFEISVRPAAMALLLLPRGAAVGSSEQHLPSSQRVAMPCGRYAVEVDACASGGDAHHLLPARSP